MTTREGSGGYQDWGELRDHLIAAFNDTPHPATEQDIIDAYELHPGTLEAAATETIAAVQNGTARSGWGVLRARATKISTPVANPTRNSSIDREKRISRAEQWLRNAGLHYDNEDEITLELFDTGKLLNEYAQAELTRQEQGSWILRTTGDHNLIVRMIRLWKELRPLGEKLEAEAIARGQADIKRRQEHPEWNRSTSPTSAPRSLPAERSTSPTNSSSPSSTSPKPPTTTNEAPSPSAPQNTSGSQPESTKPSPEPPPNDNIPL